MKTLNLKSVLAIIFASLTIVACSKKKDDVPPPAPPIVGTWVGMYGNGNEDPNTHFSFRIKDNGTLEVLSENETVDGTGTWTLEDGTFNAIYKYTGDFFQFNVAAKHDADNNTLTGSWGAGTESADDGDFFMTKK